MWTCWWSNPWGILDPVSSRRPETMVHSGHKKTRPEVSSRIRTPRGKREVHVSHIMHIHYYVLARDSPVVVT